MDPRLRHQADARGYFTRAQAIDCRLTDKHLAAARRAGVVVRLRHGAYTFPDIVEALGPAAHHALLSYIVADKLDGRVVISHTSAAAVWGLDLWSVPLDLVHVTRVDERNGRREAGVVHHAGEIRDEDVVLKNGRLVTVPARAALETAALGGIEAGVVTASSALRENVVSGEQLREAADRMMRWVNHRALDLTVRLSDPRLANVGEARSYYMFWKAGLPAPQLQVVLLNAQGEEVGRVDFDWEQFCHCAEFDGMQKYGRLNPFVQDPGIVLTHEKTREDRIREVPRGMNRFTWWDLDRPVETCDAIRAGLERSRALYARSRVIIP